MIRRFFIGLLLTGLAGCSVLPEKTPAESTDLSAHQLQLQDINRWQLTGRLAVTHRDENVNATLRWRQDGENYTLYINAPLGQGSLRLQGKPGWVKMELSSGETAFATSADELLRREYNLNLPVTALRYWILGLPEPERVAMQQIDSDGYLRSIQNSEWKLQIKSYKKIDTILLPKRLNLEGNEGSVRIIVGRWLIGDEANDPI